jgi:hypothetical protein
MSTLRSIALRRLRAIPVPAGKGLEAKIRLGFLAELAGLGIRIGNPELLDTAGDALVSDHGSVLAELAALRGGEVAYVPLFLGFPDEVPDDEYFARRLIGYVGNALECFGADEPRLESGVAVPEWLFDLRQFGADPITQMQSRSLWERAKGKLARRRSDRRAQWIDLELIPAAELADRLGAWLRRCLYARSSIKEALHADIRSLLSILGPGDIDIDAVAMKENQALLLSGLWQSGREREAAAMARTPTDVLRLLAALTGSDISLATRIRFPRLSRPRRRLLLEVLERSPALAEDLTRYRGLWLAIARGLHPGEHRRAFPKTAAAFEALCANQLTTFNARAEALLRGGDAGAALAHLTRRPGVLARRVHEMLRRFPSGAAATIDAFETVAASMTVKSLLTLKCYFASINDAAHRTVINKRGKIQVLENNAVGALSSATLTAIDTVLDRALERNVGAREPWSGRSVWIDPRLARYTVPLQQRAASDGLLTLGRGTRIPIEMDKVLRLFVYWKQASRRTDLDLSVIQFDGDFGYAGHVSYTNLAARGIVHSGDIQSAPHGAAELIDITLDAIAPGVRYLGAQVYRYCGETFAEMTCHAGWMVRADVDARVKTFDIKTVANKLDLNGTGGYAVPLLVDLEEREIVVTDLYMGTKTALNNVEGAYHNVSAASRAIAGFIESRPTMKLLAEAHARARGGRLVEDGPADIRFGIEGCSYNATDLETVLAELL